MKKLIVLMMLFASAKAQLHFNANFNDGDPTVGNTFTRHTSGLGNNDSAMVIVSSPSKSGYAIASILPSNDSSGAFFPRAEGRVDKDGADSTVPDDFFGFDVYFDNWVSDARDGLIYQTKQYDATFPSGGLWFRKIGGKSVLQWVRQADTLDANRQLNIPTVGQMQDTFTLMEITPNTWYRFDFKYNWQYSYTGRTDIFINRQLARTITGPNMNKTFSSTNKKYPPQRLGVYWFAAKAQPLPVVVRRVYFDNITVGRVADITWEAALAFYAEVVAVVERFIFGTNIQLIKAQ